MKVEKTEGTAESTQAFVVRDTSRKESLDGRGRKERRLVTGKAGEKVGWYMRMYTEIGWFILTDRRSKGEGSKSDISFTSINVV